jgi:hypothetical protein
MPEWHLRETPDHQRKVKSSVPEMRLSILGHFSEMPTRHCDSRKRASRPLRFMAVLNGKVANKR